MHYIIKHEKVLPHQKHDSHPILADYGTDQYSIRIKDRGNDIVVKPLASFSSKSVSPFQSKFKTPIQKHNKTLHQQSLLLNDTDIASDDEAHLNTRNPKHDSSFTTDKTLHEETYSTIENQSPPLHKNPHLQSVYKHISTCYTLFTNNTFLWFSFFKYRIYFQGFFLPDDYSLDLKTLQQQQSQDPVLRTVHSWSTRNEKPEFLTPLITGTPFLHAYYKRFSKLFLKTPPTLSAYTHTTSTAKTAYLFSKYHTRYSQNLSSFPNI